MKNRLSGCTRRRSATNASPSSINGTCGIYGVQSGQGIATITLRELQEPDLMECRVCELFRDRFRHAMRVNEFPLDSYKKRAIVRIDSAILLVLYSIRLEYSMETEA
jgi:hypothetical protein